MKASGWVWARPVLDGGTLYFADLDGTVYSVDTAEGRVNWQVPLDGSIRGTPVLIDGKLVVSTDKQGKIYALKTADGSNAWGPKVIDEDNASRLRLLANLAIADGKIWVAPLSAKYLLYALDPSDGSVKQWFDQNAK